MFGKNKEEEERQAKARAEEEERQAKARAAIAADRKAGKYGGVIEGMSSDEKQEFDRKKDEKIRVQEEKKKADYIDEKSKLTEKQLLAEIILLLENIRNDAKINSKTMNQKLKNIEEYSADSSTELKYSREDDKARHKENKETEWEIR